ncbi:hypothetical protein BABINDRAFT_160510 [Babjeviella inositovora NRRL Y-12698]|uniref:Mitochondrial ATPase complex subunit ATP10 n=1 Tax=Babjeviella inositovora NRRL Y-12698 TaxID=984486 RepID=A0A1E3QU56_9ASCO|nr:uncharacterized protein BABINDRAFT_160510 [Babjeviella inositovora NRRL Y-12698]ODQ81104.1 hypothetical protein BABINDRAFT_160510 [Babjeviella inositovora NRRL Y-12698]
MTTLLKRNYASGLSRLTRNFKDIQPKPFVMETLSKPFGIPQPLNLTDYYQNQNSKHKVQNFQSFKYEFFDKSRKEEKRVELAKTYSESGFYEMGIFRQTKGRIFGPPPGLFRGDKALYFPSVRGENLLGQQVDLQALWAGKINVMRVFTPRIADESSAAWLKADGLDYLNKDYEAFQARFPHSQILDLNLAENGIKGLFTRFARGSLRALTNSKRHGLYVMSTRDQFNVDLGLMKEATKLRNLYAGYLYVIDWEGKIRWACSGDVNEAEQAVLFKNLRLLEKEFTSSESQR